VEPLLLGIDVGTSSVKAVLLDLRGTCALSARPNIRCITYGPRGGADPDDWWRATCQAVPRRSPRFRMGGEGAGAGREFPRRHLAAAGCIGRPLRPAMIWMDRRAEAESARLTELLGADEIHRITGNRPDEFYVAARLLWLRITNPRF